MATELQVERAPGRPRDPRLEPAILAATVDLLAEVGYTSLTIGAVAERAGTTKPAIYRRWSSKATLVTDAVFPVLPEDGDVVPHGTSLAKDVERFITLILDVLCRPEVRAALPGLMTDFDQDHAMREALTARFRGLAFVGLRLRLDEAIAAGQARPDANADALMDALAGAAFMAALFRPREELGPQWVCSTTALVLHGVAPLEKGPSA